MSTTALVRFLSWTYLPDYISNHLLGVFHTSLYPRLYRSNPPLPNTPLHSTHAARTFALVILAYLLYTLYAGYAALDPNLYARLGVRPDVDSAGLKVAFRAFARRWHPDKVGGKEEGVFLGIRDAFEALKDPVKRFAYDRFGPDALTWSQCTTPRDYLLRGLIQASGYHIVTGCFLVFMDSVGRRSSVTFWRYILYFSLLSTELLLLLSPSPTPTPSFPMSSLPPSDPDSSQPQMSYTPTSFALLPTLFPAHTTHQHILLLHQLVFSLGVMLTRFVPRLLPDLDRMDMDGAHIGRVCERIGGLARVLDRECSQLLHTHLHSIQSPTGPTFPAHSSSTPQPNHPHELILHPVAIPLPIPPLDQNITTSSTPHTYAALRTFQLLTTEIQTLLVESALRAAAAAGPLRSAWERAVDVGVRGLHFVRNGSSGNIHSPGITYDVFGGVMGNGVSDGNPVGGVSNTSTPFGGMGTLLTRANTPLGFPRPLIPHLRKRSSSFLGGAASTGAPAVRNENAEGSLTAAGLSVGGVGYIRGRSVSC